MSGHAASGVWAVHAYLQSIEYRRDITAFHVVSDLGFDVVKPDIVITKLFHALGWLDAIMDLLEQDGNGDEPGDGAE